MLNGLDLFSGIGGLSIALKEWVRPIAYCEIDPYCQGVLLSKMDAGQCKNAPIWDDIRTFTAPYVTQAFIDIIYGGFPCQDISVAGHGKGLEGERSGLFFEIVRLAKEIKPKFIFLENVPAICCRGGITIVRQLAEMGYDCRWCVISAASVGALHKRERWFLLAYAKHSGSHGAQERGSTKEAVYDNEERKDETKQSEGSDQSRVLAEEFVPNTSSKGLEGYRDGTKCTGQEKPMSTSISEHDVPNPTSVRCNEGAGERIHSEREASLNEKPSNNSGKILNYWENTEPPVCGIPNGIPSRLDRIRSLGNSVVPSQAKEAFKILMGLS